jgi:hypothetical protein
VKLAIGKLPRDRLAAKGLIRVKYPTNTAAPVYIIPVNFFPALDLISP